MSHEFIQPTRPKAMLETEILLVEDDDFEAKTVKRAFRKARVSNDIFRVEDGIEALELLRNGKLTDAIRGRLILLVDLNMPRMNGIELLQEIRKDPNLRKLVCFVLTTSEADKDIADAYNLNIAGYIVKTRAGEEFQQLVQLLEAYWTTVRLPDI